MLEKLHEDSFVQTSCLLKKTHTQTKQERHFGMTGRVAEGAGGSDTEV